MKKILVLSLCLFFFGSGLFAADDVVGFWKTFNDKSGKPESIICVYEYQGKVYGRIIGSYNPQGEMDDSIISPKNRSQVLEGNPYFSGLDIIWNLQKDGNKFKSGKIMDPQKGKIYDAQMWNENGDLIVRGEVWVFGQNIKWIAAKENDFPAGFKKPDLAKFVPSIPKIRNDLQKKRK